MNHTSGDIPGLRRTLARLRRDLAGGVFKPGFPLPEPRALAVRYGVPREAVEQAYSVLHERDEITRVHDTCFAGTPGVILAPGFKRAFPLSYYLGEFFSLRQEEPDAAAHVTVRRKWQDNRGPTRPDVCKIHSIVVDFALFST